jgi:hypothetical protein
MPSESAEFGIQPPLFKPRLEISALLGYFLLVRVFKNTWFTRFTAREAISDDELKGIVNQLEAGQAGVDLGGGVYKVRIARPGAGKSGGYRVIVFSGGENGFFTYVGSPSRIWAI